MGRKSLVHFGNLCVFSCYYSGRTKIGSTTEEDHDDVSGRWELSVLTFA